MNRTPAQALAGKTFVIDPGHSADVLQNLRAVNALVPDGRGRLKACNTAGTATNGGYPEYQFNFEVAARVGKHLEEAGAKVVLTRQATGFGPCVDVRGSFPAKHNATALVSIHGNGSENSRIRGFFAMVVGSPLNAAQGEPSRVLARAINAALEGEGFTVSTAFGGIVDRNDLATLNFSTSPAVMMELAEFRNPIEARAVKDPGVWERYARAIARGIINTYSR